MKKPFRKKSEKSELQSIQNEMRPATIPSIEVNYLDGLSSDQVHKRIEEGLKNEVNDTLTRSTRQIVSSNVFTLFNFINLVLAILLIVAGAWQNCLFVIVAIINTCIGIYQELRAKKAVDQLSIVAKAPVLVVRDGVEKSISPDDVVLDDIIHLKAGDQIISDGILVHSEGMELDESLLTGEADTIRKKEGNKVLSGSMVTAGTGYIQVSAVGNSGYAAKLSLEAKKEKRSTSQLMKLLNRIIGVLTIVIIPTGLMLFYFRMQRGDTWQQGIITVSTSMIGMIPEGLMLLTSMAFAVGSINLARKKTLVQSMTSIETLARVDTLCLDKTGTITDGTMKVEEVRPLIDLENSPAIDDILSSILTELKDTNPTAIALRKKYNKSTDWKSSQIVPFSSKRKWSGAYFEEYGTYVMGAPEFILKDTISEDLNQQITEGAEQGFRTLLLAFSKNSFNEDQLPEDIQPVALLLLSDTIRKEAPATFRYFEEQGVALKVISGDNPLTVSKIAMRAGITGAEKYVDMSTLKENTNYKKLVEENGVFGRVSPYQKRELIRALQANGHITCMTGDGVNDVLALKEADCSVAMVDGSSAARSIADFVLLSSDFSNMIEVLKEGRRVINNIEEVASLYLVKTIYSAIFAVMYMFIPYSMPFDSRQIGPVNSFTVGIPSFLLALSPNYGRPKGKFLSNILENSVPAALTIVVDVLLTQAFGLYFGLTDLEVATMCVFFIGMVGFILLWKISNAKNWRRILMMSILMLGFLSSFFILGPVWNLGTLYSKNILFYMPLLFASYSLFNLINLGMIKLEERIEKQYRPY